MPRLCIPNKLPGKAGPKPIICTALVHVPVTISALGSLCSHEVLWLAHWLPAQLPTPCVNARLLTHVLVFATPRTVAHWASLSSGIFHIRILEWVAISSPMGSSWPRDHTQVSRIAGRRFTLWATREAIYIYICTIHFVYTSQICRWHYPYGRKWRTKEPLDESKRGEWKSWLKTQHSEN